MSQSLLDKAIAAHQQNNLDSAESLYRLFLSDNPDNADALALFGLLCSNKGQHEEAIRTVQRAIAVDPQASLFRFYLANTFMASGQIAEAIDAFRTAIALRPDLPMLHYNLGNALRQAGQDDLAMQSYKETLNFEPAHFDARNNLALTVPKK